MQDLIGYDKIVGGAMLTVVRDVLKKVDKEGLKADHHFIICFSTKSKGVVLPKYLFDKFPTQMTIVIQHQFNSLKVEEDKFKITLGFSGIYENLTIPYSSVISFSDPSVNFSLNFNYYDSEELADLNSGKIKDRSTDSFDNIDLSEKVVSLDDFRKNKK